MTSSIINTSFCPFTCDKQHGLVDPPQPFWRFRAQHPELTAHHYLDKATASWVSHRYEDVVEQIAMATEYAAQEVVYRRDTPGQDKMELPRVSTFRSPLTGDIIRRREGDCEDIAAGQKKKMIDGGVDPRNIYFVLCQDRLTLEHHMMLCVIVANNKSVLLDNRNIHLNNVNESYDFICIERFMENRWGWCSEPTQEWRDLLQVDENGFRLPSLTRREHVSLDFILTRTGRMS